MPQGREAKPSVADVIRARHRRRMEASGEPYVPLTPWPDLAEQNSAAVQAILAARRKRLGADYQPREHI